MPKGKLIKKGKFEWFEEKNTLNIKKHGFSFEDILDVFDDPYFYEIYDTKHSDSKQDRFFALGTSSKFYVVSLSYTEDNHIHLISARRATLTERSKYYERLRKLNS